MGAKMRPRWDLGPLECRLEASWGRLESLLEPLGGQDEAKMGSWRHLGGNLEATWPQLGRLKTHIVEKFKKMQPLPHKTTIFAGKMRPRWSQVNPGF